MGTVRGHQGHFASRLIETKRVQLRERLPDPLAPFAVQERCLEFRDIVQHRRGQLLDLLLLRESKDHPPAKHQREAAFDTHCKIALLRGPSLAADPPGQVEELPAIRAGTTRQACGQWEAILGGEEVFLRQGKCK
jgi:hypothetical protein